MEKASERILYLMVSLCCSICLGFYSDAKADDWDQWQGLDRDNKSKETGLLKKWPEGGPKLLWSVDGIGQGWSSASVSNGVVYVTGIQDKQECLSVFDLQGNKKWQRQYGTAFMRSHPGARTAPAITGGHVYVISSNGDVACVDTSSGEVKWSVDCRNKFGGKYGTWGYAESPLVVDGKVFFTPCGDQTTMVALNDKTGETVWASTSLNEQCAYASPILVEKNEKKQVVTVTGSYIIGVAVEDGEILWRHDYANTEPPGRGGRACNNAVTPIYHDGHIYVTSGYNHVGVMLELSEDGTEVSLKWSDKTLDCHHGGVVLVDGYIYGASWINNGDGNWVCLDWDSGKVMYEKEWFCKGSIIYADGMLYCYEEKKGNIGLVKASPKGFEVTSSFLITKGTGEHWAHPTISDGRLYMRHGDTLMVYDIKATGQDM
jgi:outer membrane protein assembly factor BamB